MLRLKELRKQTNSTQKDIARITGYQQTLISKWECGEREPDCSALKNMANYFNVSVDYLIGNEQGIKKVDSIEPTYSEQQKSCIDMMLSLDKDKLSRLEAYLIALSESESEYILKKPN